MVTLQFFQTPTQVITTPVIYRVGHAQVTFDFETGNPPYCSLRPGVELCRILNTDHRAIKHDDVNMGICQVSYYNTLTDTQAWCETIILKVSGDKILIDSISRYADITEIIGKGTIIRVKGYFHL